MFCSCLSNSILLRICKVFGEWGAVLFLQSFRRFSCVVISFFLNTAFCDNVLEKEKSGMARFWRVIPRADGAKGLSNCISGWFVCDAG